MNTNLLTPIVLDPAQQAAVSALPPAFQQYVYHAIAILSLLMMGGRFIVSLMANPSFVSAFKSVFAGSAHAAATVKPAEPAPKPPQLPAGPVGSSPTVAVLTPGQVQAVHQASAALAASQPPTPSLWSKTISMIALCAGLSVFGMGLTCKTAPGSDPLVVRTEQAEGLAYNTFDELEKLDKLSYTNSAVSNVWVPAHVFAQYLRQPVVNGTNTVPFGIATVLSLDQVKLAYQAGSASSNTLTTAIATLSATVTQALQYSSLIGLQTNVTVTLTNK